MIRERVLLWYHNMSNALWKKGQSGNPSGRPKGAKGLASYIRKETQDGEMVADFALKVLAGQPVPTTIIDAKTGEQVVHTPKLADRIWAATWLADRGFGKALASIEIADVSEGRTPFGDEQLAQLPEAKLAQIQALLETLDEDD
jgi:phage FluMu protein gp41